MCLDVVSVGAVEALLSYGLELQAAHHRVEEALQENDILKENLAELDEERSKLKEQLDCKNVVEDIKSLSAELEIAEFEAELRAELALKSSSPVKLAQASQTATYSELLMYVGLSLLLFAFALRRRVLL